jgi:2-methylcitrate dehydratase
MSAASSNNVRPAPDRVLVDVADYVLGFRVESAQTVDTARLCLTDSLACALPALDVPECARLLGPVVPGTLVPNGARVPGTKYELDPVTAAFSFGAMIRWSDLNDAFTAATGGHCSDNLAGILMLADHLSRSRVAAGGMPIRMRDVLDDLVKAYEIQGCIAIENDLFAVGTDHNVLVQVASTAVLTRMLGGTREQVIDAVSNAWIDCSLVAYRHAPNTGPRKSWACGDASARAVRHALMAMKGEPGYPSIMTAKTYGFYDARFGGRPFTFQRPYGDYVIGHSMFKFVEAGMHSQSAVECAFRLHPLVKDRLDDIERIEVRCHRALMSIMHKTGPLYNAADRDHCAQYVISIGLIHGRFGPQYLEDDCAADPRIDRLRDRMTLTEDARYSADFYDPAKRSSANSVQVFFRDGTSTPKAEVEYPMGHVRRRTESLPALQAKFEASLAGRFPAQRCEKILALCADGAKFDATPVHAFVDMLVAQ